MKALLTLKANFRLKLSPILLSPLRPYHGTRYQHATRRSKLMSSEVLKKIAARNLKSVVNTAANSQKQVAVVLPSLPRPRPRRASSWARTTAPPLWPPSACSSIRVRVTRARRLRVCRSCSPRWPSAPRRAAPDDSTNAKGKIYLCQKMRHHDPNGPVN
ncbi:hypothetical protein JG687_00019251 [Phytophthora cactorum]|uniref:Uncharacterized protein n=1 Tax=Phytophthora cactorum TaxID=29920 RepID=A0A8T1TM21_9STRA|nr:hypothetical protein JG687_00019251 [Phytophthora cactorum]